MNLSHNGTIQTTNIVFKNLFRNAQIDYYSLSEESDKINKDYILDRIGSQNLRVAIKQTLELL